MSLSTDTQRTGSSAGVRTVRIIVFGLLLIASVGFFVGFFTAHRDDGGGSLSWRGLAVLAVVLLAAAILLVQVVRDVRGLGSGLSGIPRRERASLRLMAYATGLGLVGGMVAVAADEIGLVGADGTLSPILAVLTATLLATLAPWMTWRWWRAIDEHEQSAYVEGANIAGHFVLLGGMGWWVLARARLVPEPDAMALVIAMSFVWTGVWFYRRYF